MLDTNTCKKYSLLYKIGSIVNMLTCAYLFMLLVFILIYAINIY